MKKRLLSLLIVIAMVLGMLPVSAFAVDRDPAKQQVRVIVENTTFTVDEGAPWDGVLVDTWVEINETSSMATCLVAALEETGHTQAGAENNYVEMIDGLYAGTAGSVGAGDGYDGWMVVLNDWFTNEGMAAFTVADDKLESGDEIRVMYSCYGMGEDLGGTWANNDKSVKNVTFSAGTLNQEFNSQVFEYSLTVPVGTTGVVVTPTASNKNFQVRTSDVTGQEYKRSDTVPVFDGSIVYVTCGDPSWPTMNAGEWGNGAENVPAVQYIFHIIEEVVNTAPALTGSAVTSADAEVGSAYTLDLGTIFSDADNDTLTYKVSVNGAAAVSAEKSYSYTPDAQGTVTLAFTANDGQADSPTYTVTLNVETAKARLQSLIVHTSTSPSDANVLIKNADDSYANGITFDPNTLTYNLTVASDTSNQLRFQALAANPGDKVTLHYGDNQTKDITWASGSSKWANCLSVGRNELKLEVTGEGRETVTYTLIVDQLPTLTGITASTDKETAYWGETFAATTYEYTLKIPADATTVTLTGTPKSSGVTVTYNGSEVNNVDVTNTNIIEIKLSAGEVSRTYTVTLVKAPNETVNFQVTPSDAVVKVYDAEGNSIAANAGGSFSGLFGAMEYTYTVTKYGYVAATGTVPAEGGTIVVELAKAADSDLADVDAYWPSFRGNESNQAITDVLTPIDPEKTELLWNKRGGSSWGNSPSVQIIADNALITLINTEIYKLDLTTGEVLAQGTMVAKSSYGFTAPVYAEGMIICALTGGKVQAFDAKTLESLWVYTDPRGGQDQVPVIYSDGYVYTGFWYGENKLANFVCLSITDEDPTKTDEAKTATWIHTQLGGFYWAGAAAVGDAVIVGTDDGTGDAAGTSYVYSFNKYTGSVISKLELTGMGDQRSTMAYDAESSRVYFTTKGGYLCRADVNTTTGELSNLKAVNNQAQSTSTPVVYKGKVYYGVGSGISSTGSSGNLVVADAESLEMLYAVGLKGYPQASVLLSTGYEKSTGYIYLYITYNNLPGGISMVKIDPTKDTADGAQLIELYDAEGFNQYCICSIICGPDGTLYYKNDSLNVLAVASPAENAVMVLIDAIGETVTLDSEEVITIARNAYDALTEGEKAKVTNYAELTAAENKLAQLKLDATNKAAADAVTAKISSIGTVTKDSETAIKTAREAYDALTAEQRALVSNYDVLTAAEAKLAELKQAASENPDKPQTKVEITEGGITTVPESLKQAGLDTPEEVKQEMVEAIIEKNKETDQKNVAHYDVALMYSEDGGKTWIKADETHFPANGKITVTIPYPAGTDSTYDFTVVHMFTSNAFGKTPGDVEMPKVTKAKDGIQFEVTGLSPISVGWTAPKTSDIPQTGDNTNIALYTPLMLVSFAGLAAVMYFDRKRKYAGKYSK